MQTPYTEPAAELDGRPLAALASAAQAAMDGAGITFGAKGDERFRFDPVPRLIPADEWARLEAGLAQRVRALDAYCADVYGERRIVREGVMPARVIETTDTLEPELAGLRLPLWVGIAGLDVVRAPDGRFLVLEDNLRTPSGIAYALAARATVEVVVGVPSGAGAPLPLDGVAELLSLPLAGVSPVDEPAAAVLSDGPENSAHWEHERVAELLGLPLLAPGDLSVAGDRLHGPDGPLDVVYRRTNDDRLATPIGEVLSGPWLAGTLGLVSAFGIGVGDDKLAHAYVEDMVRFYLGEEPLLASVRTFDLDVDAVREEALDRLDELVVKPRAGYGGEGVVICPHAERADVERLRAAVLAEPGDFIAQELIPLSRHPTVIDGELAPRHVDLRPFVFLGPGGEARVLPGGLTRVAFDEGALVVNSSQNGGAKDTWVLS
jgi:uncharacterized circularly permuted ATP-grasp superfamily protein